MDPLVWIVIMAVSGPVIGSASGILKMPTFGYICNMLCFAAGVMLAISFLELIPQSCAGSNHRTIFSLILGVIFVIILGGF